MIVNNFLIKQSVVPRQNVAEVACQDADMGDLQDSRPAVSVISAVYNVSAYLGEFFDSLRKQTLDHSLIEVVLVDDGSIDGSLALCEAFADNWDGPVRVLTKENGGQSSARNMGIDVAVGKWLSFVDPDDMLDPKYFEALTGFANLPKNSNVTIHAAKMLLFYEATGISGQAHSLNSRFGKSNRVVDLGKQPKSVQLSAATALFRGSTVKRLGLRFDERVRPNFEDASFIARFLLEESSPLIGLVAEASYLYRKRAARNSSLDLALVDKRRYTDVLRYGHLEVLTAARGQADLRDEAIPRWIQNIVLYDLLWIFKDCQSKEMQSVHFDDDVYSEFIGLLDRVLSYLSDEAIDTFDVMPVPWWCLPALLLRKRGLNAHTAVTPHSSDSARGLVSRAYIYVGERPSERVTVQGRSVEPHFGADREFCVLNRPFAYERNIWIAAGPEIKIWLNGVQQAVYSGPRQTRETFLWYSEAMPEPKVIEPSSVTSTSATISNVKRRSFRELFSKEAAQARKFERRVRRYTGAWVVMDRDIAGNDCGEVFFKWLKSRHPEIQSHFVIRDDVPDWARLRAEGVRPIAHGSPEWKALMLGARHMISSQVDDYVINPLPVREYGPRNWFFTFLQHGVIKDNIFNWLNQKKLDVFVTSTQDEYAYCAGPGPSKFGNREVRMTGLARFDDLLARSLGIQEDQIDLIVVAPTWRQYLAGARVQGNERVLNDGFMKTTYAKAWSALLRSRDLKAIADQAGATIAFMPHTNIQPYLDDFDLPSYVKILRHEDINIRDVLARSKMMITDYSSIAFDMAYLYRHVVYYQFDRREFFSGGHIFSPGYFDYVEDGFGPVSEDLGGVMKGVEAVLTGTIDDSFATRMRRTFPVRDGKNCERTYDAIIAASSPLNAEDSSTAAPLDTWERVTS